MSFKIVVTEVTEHPDGRTGAVQVERFVQTVETLDLRKVIDAINYRPRVRKAKTKVTS